jgi:hypothetical protein
MHAFSLTVADLEGGSDPLPFSPNRNYSANSVTDIFQKGRVCSECFSPEIYHLIFVKLEISNPKYLNFLLFLNGGPPSPERPPPLLFEISGSATVWYFHALRTFKNVIFNGKNGCTCRIVLQELNRGI